MKKTVNINGAKAKIDFAKANHTKVIDRMEGIQTAEAHGTVDYLINDKSYTVKWTVSRKPRIQRTLGLKLYFEGFSCGDNEKKMIEFIISKYGV